MLVRCPHCRDSIELLDEAALDDVDCPTCGSRFSLVGTELSTVQQAKQAKPLGHFTLTEQLGMGAYGTVWKAHDTELDRLVAIKIPRREQLDQTDTEKFLREARAAAQLNHPNIVSVHEVGREDDTLYIVSDLIEGITLTDWLTGERPTPREAAAFCEKVADALEHAHEHGVVHRDLKPGNIMLDQKHEPHIMDFGLAKREASEVTMTLDGQILGTPAYMSPEQAKGEGYKVDRRADIYSLGVILFELLTGERPFRGNARMLIHQLVNEDAPSPRKLNPSIPRDLETICLKCLEKDPAKRYGSAKTLAEEFQRFLAGKPIHARPLHAPARVWRWCRRRPVIAGLLTFAIVSLVTGTSVSVYFAIEAQKQAQDALEKLRGSYLAQARAVRWSGRAGRRFDGLDALSKAAEISPGPDLRDEVIASLTLVDLREISPGVHIPGNIRLVAVDDDFLRYAFGSEEGTITVRQVSDEKELAKIPGNGIANAWILKFSPDGRFLAVGFSDGRLLVWDFEKRKPVLQIPHGYHLFAVDFAPDGQRLATAQADGWVTVFDLLENTSEKFQINVIPHSLQFDPEGRRLAVSSIKSRTVGVYAVADGKVLERLPHDSGTRGLSWNPVRNQLATSGSDGIVYLWDLSPDGSQQTLRRLEGHNSEVSRIAFNHTGEMLASNSWDGGLILWDLNADRPLLQVPAAAVPDVIGFSRDDRFLGLRLVDDRLSFWEVDPANELRILHEPGETRLWSVALSPDEELLATARDSGVTIWSTSSERRLAQLEIGSTRSVFFLPERDAMLTWGQNGLSLWPLTRSENSAGNAGLEIGPGQPLGVNASSRPEWASIDAAGRLVAMADRGAASVQVYDLDAGKVVLRESYGNPSSIVISPDGKWVACGTWRAGVEMIRVWNVESGQIVQEVPSIAGAVLAFSSDSQFLIFNSNDLDYEVLDTRHWKSTTSLPREGPGGVGIAYSKDASLLSLGIAADRVRVFDAQSLKPLANLAAGEPLLFSDSGRWLLARRRDQSVELWDLARIRTYLRGLKLDWDTQPLPEVEPPPPAKIEAIPEP